MIEINSLSEYKNSDRFGSCSSCGIEVNKSRQMYRITFRTESGGGTSVCLCNRCTEELLKKLKDRAKK